VGGPGDPVTPLQQSEMLFDLFDKEPKYLKVRFGFGVKNLNPRFSLVPSSLNLVAPESTHTPEP